MNNKTEIYEKQNVVNMSVCDNLSLLSYPAFFDAFMDMATLHGNEMGVSSLDLAKHNLFWVVTRSKIKFFRRPHMLEEYTLRTWPTTPELLRSLRFCSFIDEQGVFAQGKTEWIMLNKDNFRPSKTSGVYPDRLKFSDKTILDEPWEKIVDDFSTFDKEYIYTVKSTDIDLSNHMNNVAYIRALFSTFSTKQIENMDIKEMELHYKSQCFEGDSLALRIKKTEKGFLAAFIKNGEQAVTINVRFNLNIM